MISLVNKLDHLLRKGHNMGSVYKQDNQPQFRFGVGDFVKIMGTLRTEPSTVQVFIANKGKVCKIESIDPAHPIPYRLMGIFGRFYESELELVGRQRLDSRVVEPPAPPLVVEVPVVALPSASVVVEVKPKVDFMALTCE